MRLTRGRSCLVIGLRCGQNGLEVHTVNVESFAQYIFSRISRMLLDAR